MADLDADTIQFPEATLGPTNLALTTPDQRASIDKILGIGVAQNGTGQARNLQPVKFSLEQSLGESKITYL